MRAADVERFAAAIRAGGVGVFPADTVYGLACDPDSVEAARRIYELKGRPPAKPAAVMFFARERALEALPELGKRTALALAELLPGAVTVVVPNPHHRFPLACGPDPDSLGLRVPGLAGALAPLAALEGPLLQTSANPSGAADARRLADVPAAIRAGADAELDAGELPGVASTVIDLRRYEDDGRWELLREGAVERVAVARALDG